MSNIEAAEIIQLFGARPKSGRPIARPRGTESEPRDIVSDTCSNQRLRDLVRFAQRHRVDCEWMLTGNLRGLLRTVRRCRMTELTPKHVLADLFDSEDFPATILNPKEAAEIVIHG
jgi:hypothetical protein